ncbi:cytochrome c biogenesis CcdA family protein [Desmospora profundinema]|uniref:Cytochrome c-type biogenesis protein n=1 Tax=Desmospora profundinema TaxID=1571184 RepID=A0ABU1ISU1_9BACL|nr:cytochrome c biogenesis protein CcdA [Desmospora profundinema]MDR6226840.1 cytochrome c-type biogenesis protein [Desmospora profundinema]
MTVQMGLAFLAGLLSFLSPCTLPLYPAYLSRLTGLSFTEIRDQHKMGKVRLRILSHTAVFVLGISLIYVMLGFSATLVGGWFVEYRSWIRIGSGILFIIMGFMLMGLFQLKGLLQDRRWMSTDGRTISYTGSFLFGLGFAAGWTPCIGPMLSSIIGLAAVEPANGLLYMMIYVLGFSLPFFLFSFFFPAFKRFHAYSSTMMKAGGVIIIGVGILLITDQLAVLSVYLNDLVGFTGYL